MVNNKYDIMKLNFDFKNILLIIFAICTLVFFGLWYFKTPNTDVYELQRKQLEQKLADKDKEIDLVKSERDSLEKKNAAIVLDIEKNEKNIEAYKLQIAEKDKQLQESKSKLANYIAEKNKIVKEIENLKNNPVKKTGQDLLDALK